MTNAFGVVSFVALTAQYKNIYKQKPAAAFRGFAVGYFYTFIKFLLYQKL